MRQENTIIRNEIKEKTQIINKTKNTKQDYLNEFCKRNDQMEKSLLHFLFFFTYTSGKLPAERFLSKITTNI